MRYLLSMLCIGMLVLCGCGSEPPHVGGPPQETKAVTELPPITAAYVEVGRADEHAARAQQSGLPGWIQEEAGRRGLVVYVVGVWQELPTTTAYGILQTARETVDIRILERGNGGSAVVNVSGHVSRASQRCTLEPGGRGRWLVHLGGRDAVALRLGWEEPPPPRIFARAIMVHQNAAIPTSWPKDLPLWAVRWLGDRRATGVEDLGSNTWTRLGPDPLVIGTSPDNGDILAHIVDRDRNDWFTAAAGLSRKGDERGNAAWKMVTIQPVIPGNNHPGTICVFQPSGDEASYVAVIFSYGPVGPSSK